ncbi:hypothetical protein HK097_003419 [Rhizophlyctis rosea]|uniref:Ankyrin n=1 Tax=Rhizophlyctis rosea TaxID=64517 RepID=A0AAD5X7G8_9FUNG|nr:hypothetical protein HK097_003419 [Rhizophlyctis rosea]
MPKAPPSITNSLVWAEVAKRVPLPDAAHLRSLSRLLASAVSTKSLARLAADYLYQRRGRYALYDVDQFFSRRMPDALAVVMVEILLTTYSLAPPLLPRLERILHWRKRRPNNGDDEDEGGVTFGVEDGSLNWMDGLVYEKDAEIVGDSVIYDSGRDWDDAAHLESHPWTNKPQYQLWLAVCANHAVCRAARWGLRDTVQTLMKHGANPEAHCGLPLASAAWAGHDEVVRDLLAAGVDPKGHYAAYFAAQAGHISIVQTLIEAGALGQFDADYDEEEQIDAEPKYYSERELYANELVDVALQTSNLQLLNTLLPLTSAIELPNIIPLAATKEPQYLSAIFSHFGEAAWNTNVMADQQCNILLAEETTEHNRKWLADFVDATDGKRMDSIMYFLVRDGRVELVKILLKKCSSDTVTGAFARLNNGPDGEAFLELAEMIWGTGLVDLSQIGDGFHVFCKIARNPSAKAQSLAETIYPHLPPNAGKIPEDENPENFYVYEGPVRGVIALGPLQSVKMVLAPELGVDVARSNWWFEAWLERSCDDAIEVLEILVRRGVKTQTLQGLESGKLLEEALKRWDRVTGVLALVAFGADLNMVKDAECRQRLESILTEHEGTDIGGGKILKKTAWGWGV